MEWAKEKRHLILDLQLVILLMREHCDFALDSSLKRRHLGEQNLEGNPGLCMDIIEKRQLPRMEVEWHLKMGSGPRTGPIPEEAVSLVQGEAEEAMDNSDMPVKGDRGPGDDDVVEEGRSQAREDVYHHAFHRTAEEASDVEAVKLENRSF